MSTFTKIAVATLTTIALFVLAGTKLPADMKPGFLLSQLEKEEQAVPVYLRNIYNSVREGRSTDPSMAMRMVTSSFQKNNLTYAGLGTTQDEFNNLVNKYGIGLSRSIFESALNGTFTGGELRLYVARSDLEAFGYSLVDVGLTEEKFLELIETYSDDQFPTSSSDLGAIMSQY